MKRSLFYGIALAALFLGACKSGNKEVTSETAVDTSMVKEPVGVISIDSVAVAEENMKTPVKAADKSVGAEKKPSGAAKEQPGGAAGKDAALDVEKGVVEFPSKRATYPGGQAALNQYLAANIKYPTRARENGIEGTVYASIIVDELGSILDVSFPKPLGYGLEEEVLRVVKGMPKLIPAEDKSKPVKTKYVLPVKFDLN
jgi:periplasmic protein TonB